MGASNYVLAAAAAKESTQEAPIIMNFRSI